MLIPAVAAQVAALANGLVLCFAQMTDKALYFFHGFHSFCRIGFFSTSKVGLLFIALLEPIHHAVQTIPVSAMTAHAHAGSLFTEPF